jgi:hypothetical protein
MKSIKKVTALIGSAVALTLLAAGPVSALGERSRSQTFVLYGAGSTFDHPISVFAAGPISGVGSFEIVEERSGPHGDDFTAELIFPGRGTVTMEVRGQSSITLDPTSCAGSQTGRVHWTITGGTGQFANASGSGTGTYTGRFVVERGASGCVEDHPVVSVFVARLTGTASLSAAQAA